MAIEKAQNVRSNMASKEGAGDMDTAEVPLDFEEDLVQGCSSTPDSKFDVIIGHIEEIIMEDEFQQLQQDFMDKYYLEFEDTEENKFCYTEIHKEYIDLIEKYLITQLSERMDDFEMGEFQKEIVQRKDELFGEVFEMLLTFSDFIAFKEMFIDYRNEKEGNVVDFSQDFVVHSLTVNISTTSKANQAASRTGSDNRAALASNLAPATAAASDSHVFNLELGSQSCLISTPGGANGLDFDFAPQSLQIGRAGPGSNSAAGVAKNGPEFGVSGNGVFGSGLSNGEDMHVSPRTTEKMDE